MTVGFEVLLMGGINKYTLTFYKKLIYIHLVILQLFEKTASVVFRINSDQTLYYSIPKFFFNHPKTDK